MTDTSPGRLLHNDVLRCIAAVAIVGAAAITGATPLILIAMFVGILLAAPLVDRRWWYLVGWLVAGTFLLVAAILATAGSSDPWVIAIGEDAGTNVDRLEALDPAVRVAVGARTALGLHLLMAGSTPFIRFRERILDRMHQRSVERRR